MASSADEKALTPDAIIEKAAVNAAKGTLRSNVPAALAQIEDRLLTKSARIVQSALSASELDDDAVGPPGDWVTKWGEKEARRRFRIAMDARRNSKNAPVYLEHAKAMTTGILKAKGGRQDPDKGAPLNIQVNIAGDVKVYPEIEVSGEGEGK